VRSQGIIVGSNQLIALWLSRQFFNASIETHERSIEVRRPGPVTYFVTALARTGAILLESFEIDNTR
jgi:hypothetical protein